MAEETGEQLELLDVAPEQAKELIEAGKKYKKFQAQRLKAAGKEAEQKALICELVEASDLQRLAGGIIKFEAGDLTFKITPRDELVQVTEKKATPAAE